MARIIESYKVSSYGGANHRRETEKSALSLADRLQRAGKHGVVEAVVWDNEIPELGIEFVKVKTF